MNQKSKALTRRKFIGDITVISAFGALGFSGISGVGAVVVSRKEQQHLKYLQA